MVTEDMGPKYSYKKVKNWHLQNIHHIEVHTTHRPTVSVGPVRSDLVLKIVDKNYQGINFLTS